MKICHISDVHFRGIARHKEYSDAFNHLFQYLKDIVKPDLIINTGDFYHSKTSCLTPEVITIMSWCINELAAIAPTYSILGNHDLSLTSNRDNIISSIHKAINNPRATLYEESGNYIIKEFPNVCLNVLSPTDPERWGIVQPQNGLINIALFHGAVKSSKTDTGWVLETYEASVIDFTKFDFAFLGDIHKQQYLGYRLDNRGNEKPWIGYPGSFIQQNHGEEMTKGVLVWDIESREDWDVKFVPVANNQPFITIPWHNSSSETIMKLPESSLELNNARFRVSSSYDLSQLERKQISWALKEQCHASEVVFKYDKTTNNIDNFETKDGVFLSKKRLRNDPETVSELYRQFIQNNATSPQFQHLTDGQIERAVKEIEKYIARLNSTDEENGGSVITPTTSLPWVLNYIEFDNLFQYGEGNRIDFHNKEGLIGIFGPNRWGKSSSVAAIMYALFNTTDRGPLRGVDIINQKKSYCSAKVSITVSGKEYIIERTTTKSKKDDSKSAGKVELFEVEAKTGNLINLNQDSRCDTDKQIRQIIGSPEDFFLTTLAAQNDLNRFIAEGSTKRKKYLAKFLEIDIFESLYDFAKEDVNALSSSSGVMSDAEYERTLSQLTKSIQGIQMKTDKHTAKRKVLNEKKEKVQYWIANNKQNAESVDSKLLIEISLQVSANRQTLESNCKELASTKLLLAEKEKQIHDAKVFIEGSDIKALETELVLYTDLKDSIQALQHKLEVERKTLSSQEKSVKKLTIVPCGDSFPSCLYIQDAHKDKELIQAQAELVAELVENFDRIASNFDPACIGSTQAKINHRNKVVGNLGMYMAQKDKLEESIRRLDSSMDSLRKETTALELQEKDLIAKVSLIDSTEFKAKTEQLSTIQSELGEIEQESRKLFIELGSNQSQLAVLKTNQDQHKDLLDRVRVFSSIQNAFSKTGIPAMILKTQLPAINAELAKILSTIVDFKIELEAEQGSNSMDVYMIDGHSKRIIELCSGMEKTICSIALRVALINLSSLPRPDMFIMDEPFGALDEDNQQKCLELLETLKQYFNQVIVISHEAPVKELADTIIEIANDGIHASIIA